ncbi:hypothetical protein HYT23_04920 [Candidatus Pacearchaeota archaeon]|nr:hypothetical protein [Candidatus Pacearchaeota archaeon]
MEQTNINCSQLKEKIEKYLELGFDISYTGPVLSSTMVVKTPSGRQLSLSAIERNLQGLEFGNKEQIELLKALDFFNLCGEYRESVLDFVRLNSRIS